MDQPGTFQGLSGSFLRDSTRDPHVDEGLGFRAFGVLGEDCLKGSTRVQELGLGLGTFVSYVLSGGPLT